MSFQNAELVWASIFQNEVDDVVAGLGMLKITVLNDFGSAIRALLNSV
jgi:hypothetical protein